MNLNVIMLELFSAENASALSNLLAWVGAGMVGLNAIRPAVSWIVKRTETEADDRLVKRLYDFFDYLSPDVWNAIKRLAGRSLEDK